MKNHIKIGLLAMLSLFASKVHAIDVPSIITNPTISNETALASSGTYVVDVNALQASRVTAFVTYATVTPSPILFTDGRVATAAVTISSPAALSSAPALALLVVTSNTALSNAYFSLTTNAGTFIFREGAPGSWSRNAFSTATAQQNFSTRTAVSIANTVNFSSYGVTASTSANNVVRIRALDFGTIGNSYSMFSSTLSALSSGTFRNGRDVTTFKINNVSFRPFIEYMLTNTASGTAKSLSLAIASSAVSNVIGSSWAGSVVYTTANFVNVTNHALFTSSNAALTISSVATSYSDGSALGYMIGARASNIDITGNRISTTPNALTNGLAVQFTSVTGTSPAPLLSRTTYFVINTSTSGLQLSFTSTGVIAGLVIDITTTTQRGGGSFVLTPVPYSASAPQPSFKFQVSNDSTTWIDVTGQFSMTQSSATALDFGNMNYRYLREEVRSSSNTAIIHKTVINGKP